jgi:hypothetical protein
MKVYIVSWTNSHDGKVFMAGAYTEEAIAISRIATWLELSKDGGKYKGKLLPVNRSNYAITELDLDGELVQNNNISVCVYCRHYSKCEEQDRDHLICCPRVER